MVGQKGHRKTYYSISFIYKERERREREWGPLNGVAPWAGVLLFLEVIGCQTKQTNARCRIPPFSPSSGWSGLSQRPPKQGRLLWDGIYVKLL